MKAIPLSTPLRVLVVDDWPDTAESLAVLLRLWGHDVRIAHDGPTALAVAALYRPHVVLLDVGLPGMDGYQVAWRMRNDLRLRETFLVSLTGYGQDSDRGAGARPAAIAICSSRWIPSPGTTAGFPEGGTARGSRPDGSRARLPLASICSREVVRLAASRRRARVEIFAAVRPRPCFPIEADQPFIVRCSIFLADVVEDTSLVEFGEIRLEVKIP